VGIRARVRELRVCNLDDNLSRTSPDRRTASPTRSRQVAWRATSGILAALRRPAVCRATEWGDPNLAARQRSGLEDPLVPDFRLYVRLSGRALRAARG